MKKKRTESRKDALLELYKSCKSQADGFYDEELFEKLSNESNSRLRRDQLYLYYTQMGRSMYSGKRIDFDKLINDKNTYDIDHIYPRSKIKDDSITNRVLVERILMVIRLIFILFQKIYVKRCNRSGKS